MQCTQRGTASNPMPRSYHRFHRPTIPLRCTPGSDPRSTHIARHPNALSSRLGASRRRIKFPCMMQSGKAASLRSSNVPTAGPQAARWRAANATLMHLDGALTAGSRVCDVQRVANHAFCTTTGRYWSDILPCFLIAPAYLFMYSKQMAYSQHSRSALCPVGSHRHCFV